MTVSLKQRNYDGPSLSVQIRELNQLARVGMCVGSMDDQICASTMVASVGCCSI